MWLLISAYMFAVGWNVHEQVTTLEELKKAVGDALMAVNSAVGAAVDAEAAGEIDLLAGKNQNNDGNPNYEL